MRIIRVVFPRNDIKLIACVPWKANAVAVGVVPVTAWEEDRCCICIWLKDNYPDASHNPLRPRVWTLTDNGETIPHPLANKVHYVGTVQLNGTDFHVWEHAPEPDGIRPGPIEFHEGYVPNNLGLGDL